MNLQSLKAINETEKVILEEAKKNKQIVYGARAMNKQIPFSFLRRKTKDWDIYSNKPKTSASKVKRKLNKIAGSKTYYSKRAIHEGTYKVMHKGDDGVKSEDDYGIADYTNNPKKLKTKTINRVRYAHMSSIKKDRVTSLKDKESKFRHKKDKRDLDNINLSRKLKGFLRQI